MTRLHFNLASPRTTVQIVHPPEATMRSPRTARTRQLLPLLLSGTLVAVLASCRSDAPSISAPSTPSATRSSDAKVNICHNPSPEGGDDISVSINALAAHLAHGDYIAGFDVDKQNTAGDGIRFTRITDALATARSTRRKYGEMQDASCAIVITVGPGTFTGAYTPSTDATLELFPLVIDVPEVTLQGGLRMQVDAKGRATASSLNETGVTTLAPNRALVNAPKPEAMIVVTYTGDGFAGNGAVIDGFAFSSGRPTGSTTNGGFGIASMQVTDLVISNNRFATALQSAMDLRATSAEVERNYAKGLGAGCGFCFAGPGEFQVASNTLVDGIRVGMLFIPVTLVPVSAGIVQYTPKASESITATVTNNSVTDHTRHAAGFATAVRILATGVPGVLHSTKVDLGDNDLLRNSFGLMIDGGSRGANLRGDAVVTLNGNTIAQSCRRDLLVSFASPNRALGQNTTDPYSVNSAYTLSLGGSVSSARTWYDHPTGYGNTLIVDGSPIGNTLPLPVLVPTAPCS